MHDYYLGKEDSIVLPSSDSVKIHRDQKPDRNSHHLVNILELWLQSK